MNPAAPQRADDRPLAQPGRALDAPALHRISRRLHAADQPPWLHQEVARRMAERLSIVLQKPRRVLDWGAHLGGGQALLRQAYPNAVQTVVECDGPRHAAALQDAVKPWWHAGRWIGQATLVQSPGGVPPAGADLLWSNMALHLLPDPPSTFAQWHRALEVDGFLMFSTLGPGSLTQLQALYRQLGWAPPFAPFVDMHDLGDMMVQAGFADPVMDQELITLTWPSAEALLNELRQVGGNAHSARFAGLRTPRWRGQLLESMAQRRNAQGRVELQFELVYGHAFKPLPRPRVAATTQVAVEDLRRMARSARTAR
jgi:malonyl-CoA O-methyltransferase